MSKILKMDKKENFCSLYNSRHSLQEWRWTPPFYLYSSNMALWGLFRKIG